MHTDTDYIEIRSLSDTEINLQGLRLDDSPTLSDFTFPTCVVPAGGFWIGTEEETESYTYGSNGDLHATCAGSFTSGLSKEGDTIYIGLGTDAVATGAVKSVSYSFTNEFIGTIHWDSVGMVEYTAVALTSLDLSAIYVQEVHTDTDYIQIRSTSSELLNLQVRCAHACRLLACVAATPCTRRTALRASCLP